VTENKLGEERGNKKRKRQIKRQNAKLRSKPLIHWVSWVCSYWALRFREVGVPAHVIVLLEELTNDSLWTHCKCFYSAASVDHSSHVFTGGEVCFAEVRRIVSAGARFNSSSLRRVSSLDAGIDPRTQATITTTSGRMCPLDKLFAPTA
jgi:hypothetical protein